LWNRLVVEALLYCSIAMGRKGILQYVPVSHPRINVGEDLDPASRPVLGDLPYTHRCSLHGNLFAR